MYEVKLDYQQCCVLSGWDEWEAFEYLHNWGEADKLDKKVIAWCQETGITPPKVKPVQISRNKHDYLLLFESEQEAIAFKVRWF